MTQKADAPVTSFGQVIDTSPKVDAGVSQYLKSVAFKFEATWVVPGGVMGVGV